MEIDAMELERVEESFQVLALEVPARRTGEFLKRCLEIRRFQGVSGWRPLC